MPDNEEHIRQLQKLEAIGQLAGGVAHDFNNLLTVINGYSELLLSRDDLSAPVRKQLEMIHKTGHRAAELTQSLLAFSRQQMLRPSALDLNAVVREAAPVLRGLLTGRIELATKFDANLGAIKADRSQIEEVLVNLAANARDAMENGGTLTLETANIELDAEFGRRYASVKTGPHVQLTVSDTGRGMDAETQKRVFEPFFTTKEKGQGTGLGLSSVYGIVKQSGGSIWVESQPGRGATFKLYFPRIESQVKTFQSAPAGVALAAGKRDDFGRR